MSGERKQVVLYYWSIRGVAQPIRSLMCYLEIPFEQQGEDSQVTKEEGNDNFFNAGLPRISYDGHMFSQLGTIMRYLANKQKRSDLNGTTPQSQGRINELLSKYFLEKGTFIPFLINAAIECCNKGGDEENQYGDKILKKFIQKSKFIQGCLIFSRGQNYIMGYITILDFLFHDLCFYICNLFPQSGKYDQNVKAFHNYKNMFQKAEFYLSNKQKLNSKHVFIPFPDKKLNQIIQNIWAADIPKLFG